MWPNWPHGLLDHHYVLFPGAAAPRFPHAAWSAIMQNGWKDFASSGLVILFLLLTMAAAILLYQAEDATPHAISNVAR